MSTFTKRLTNIISRTMGNGSKGLRNGKNASLRLTRLEDKSVPSAVIYATGADTGGGPHVKVFNTDHSLKFEFFAFAPTFTGGTRVATGDVNGDGNEDVIVGAGPGGGPHVKVFNGVNGALISELFVFDASYNGGVFVGAADVNGDGKKEVVISGAPNPTVRTEVKVFSGLNMAQLPGQQGYFTGYTCSSTQPGYGGSTVAGMYKNSDNKEDIMVGAPNESFYGLFGTPAARIVDGSNGTTSLGTMATGSPFVGGRVYVSCFGGTPVLSYWTYNSSNTAESRRAAVTVYNPVNLGAIYGFLPFPDDRNEARVLVKDLTGDGVPEILTAQGPVGPPKVRVYSSQGFNLLYSFTPYQYAGGAFIG